MFGDTSKSGVGNVEGKGKGRFSGVVGGNGSRLQEVMSSEAMRLAGRLFAD